MPARKMSELSVVTFTIYTYLICLAFSFICSGFNFRKHPLHLKLLSVLLFITLINECIAFWGHKFLNLSNNLKVYNVFIPIEVTFYCLYFKCVISLKWFKYFVGITLIVFFLFWYTTTFKIFQIQKWNSYVSIFENVIITFMATAYYYQLFILSPLKELRKHTEFWIATGLIICYTCTLPFTGMLNYLLSNYDVYEFLAGILVVALQIFNIILYSLIAYAFLCRINTRKLLWLQ